MAGWSMVAGGSAALDCRKAQKRNETDDPKRCVSDVPEKFRCWFDRFIGSFLREICARDLFRPLPPMIGNGQRVDLVKLFWAARRRGGFDSVSRIGVWDSVSEECGFGLSLGWAVKLVYDKYLHLLEKVIENKDLEWSLASTGIDFDFGEHLMDLDHVEEFFSGQMLPRSFKGSDEVVNVLDFCSDGVSLDSTKSMEEAGKLCGNDDGVESEVGESGAGMSSGGGCDGVVSSLGKRKRELFGSEEGESQGGKRNGNADEEDVTVSDPCTAEEVSSPCKRKQESLCEMLSWVKMAATDPSDAAVGSLPERSKWNCFGHEEQWKRVLLAREAIFQKRLADSGAQLNWQKNQKMHPSMYEDNSGSAYNLRERLKLEKKLGGTTPQPGAHSDSSSASDLDKSSPGVDGRFLGTSEYSSSNLDKYGPSRIPQGPNYQAHVPEWTGEASASEMKWARSKVWPLEKPENRYLIERDPIGKGRQESCGCQWPGSTECVAFHISEKRLRLKVELGPAFYNWEFNQMGEEVGLSWTAEEEKKFDDIIKSNPPSLGYGFWGDIYQFFAKKKSRKELVSYYFNVYLLRRRGYQNRFTPDNIDSDDEESELGSVTNGCGNEEHKSSKSILISPHKPHAKYRPV